MRALLTAAVCVVLTGCDYTVPLVDKPDMAMETQLIGLWEKSDGDNKAERLLILPLSKQEHLVAYPYGGEGGLFAKACACRIAEKLFVQLEWFGTAEGTLPDDGRVYQYATYQLRDGELEIRLLNADVVSREISSPAELKKAIETQKDTKDYFREAMVFRRLTKQ